MLKKNIAILTIILLASALLSSSVLTRDHAWGDDFAAYIMQAKSILDGDMDEFVAANTFTVAYSTGTVIGPVTYPWGFPLLLVPVYALTGLNPLALKLPGWLAFLGFLLIFFFLTRYRLTLIESALVVSLLAFNPNLLLYQNNIVSDIPFMFFSILAIYLADSYTHETRISRRLVLTVIISVSIFVAFFIRTVGLTLLSSMLLYQGISFIKEPKQRQQLAIESLVIIVIFGILWGIATLLFPGGEGSYLALYSEFNLNLLKGNIVSVSIMFGDFFLPLPASAFIFYIFVAFFLIGIVVRFKEDLLFTFYVIMNLIALWTFPAPQAYRYLFPILPFFIYFTTQGFKGIIQKAGKKYKSIISKTSYAFLGLIVIAFTIDAGLNSFESIRRGQQRPRGAFTPLSMQTYNYIVNNTPNDSIIVFSKPRAMRMMTDRNSLASITCDGMLMGDYLVLKGEDSNNPQKLPEYITNCNLPLTVVFKNRQFVVYQILKEKP